jgi:hypothetical protein
MEETNMLIPFQRIANRPGLRRVLIPFTLALAFVAVAAFALAGA